MSPSGPVMLRRAAHLDRSRVFHRHIGARDDLRDIDDGNERRAAGRHFAG